MSRAAVGPPQQQVLQVTLKLCRSNSPKQDRTGQRSFACQVLGQCKGLRVQVCFRPVMRDLACTGEH